MAAPKAVANPNFCNNAVLRQATRRMGQLYDEALAPSGLRATQVSMLTQIQFMAEPSMRELADELVIDLSALGHALKPLTRDNLVELLPDAHDRRAKRVRLTAHGKRKLDDTLLLWQTVHDDFEAAFGSQNAAALRSALSYIASDTFSQLFAEKRTAAKK